MSADDAGPSTAWDIDVAWLVAESAAPLNVCKDIVILKWLLAGDARPLGAYLLDGHIPGPELCRLLGVMIAAPNLAKGAQITPALSKLIPFQFQISRREGQRGRYPDMEKQTIGRLLAENAKLQGYNRAVDQFMEIGQATGAGISRDTLEKLLSERSTERKK